MKQTTVVNWMQSLWPLLLGIGLLLVVNVLMLAPLLMRLALNDGPIWYGAVVVVDLLLALAMFDTTRVKPVKWPERQKNPVFQLSVVLLVLHCISFGVAIWTRPGLSIEMRWVLSAAALLFCIIFAIKLNSLSDAVQRVIAEQADKQPDYYAQLQQARGRIEELEVSLDVAYEVQREYEAELQAAQEKAAKQAHFAERYRLQAEQFQLGLTEAMQNIGELEEQLAEAAHNKPEKIVTEWVKNHNTTERIVWNGTLRREYRLGKGELKTVEYTIAE